MIYWLPVCVIVVSLLLYARRSREDRKSREENELRDSWGRRE